jgi:hypothetical protein
MQLGEVMQPVEAFLLIEQPRQRLGHWTKALSALDAPDAPQALAIIAYYDPTCDQALIDLQYEPARANMSYVIEVALLAEVGMVQPAELSEGERARFLADRLTRCTIRVTTQRTAVGALTELVRKIKDVRAHRAPASQPPPIPAAALARSVAPRGDTHDPVMLVQAKGTRDNLERLPDPADEAVPTPTERNQVARGSARTLKPTARMSARSLDDLLGDGPEPPPPPREGVTTGKHELAREDRHRTVPMPLEMSQKLIGESSQMMDLRTLPKPPERKTPPPELHARKTPPPQPQTEPPLPSPALSAPSMRIRTEQTTEPYLPAPSGLPSPHVIYARYLRGGRWVPVRVGALSLKGAALLAGALPRVNDRIDVALTFGSYRAIVRGVVGKVSSMREAAASGASTFTVAFELDDSTKRQLTQLLLAARDAKVTIKPPPPRATRRFPVEWQIALGTVKGAVKATALDVSTFGMFVQPAVPLEVSTTLTFSVVLDDASSPIAGRARVVRKINDSDAKNCGLIPGFGLVIVSMSEADKMRWLGFLARIERRADKRVLIGAEPARLAELQAGLASLGYAVTGGTDPGALVQLVSSDARPADAVLIDAGWLANEASASLMETLLSARNVPCVTMNGEAKRARQAIDKLLEVVV